jgi:hypothetical protein
LYRMSSSLKTKKHGLSRRPCPHPFQSANRTFPDVLNTAEQDRRNGLH